MKCLHLCNDYNGSKVHVNLYRSLKNTGVEQTIFYPSRKKKEDIPCLNKGSSEYQVIVSRRIRTIHRILYYPKIAFLYRDLRKAIQPEEYDIVHATTLFSDGALALKLKEDCGIPYIVSIRATDLELFVKYRPDVIPLGKKILAEAGKVIFISRSLYKKYLKSPLNKGEGLLPDSKISFIYNGIDEYWLKNRIQGTENTDPPAILYVGSLVKRKNPLNLIKAVIALNENKYPLRLTLIGKDQGELKKIKPWLDQYPGILKYTGPVQERKELMQHFRNHRMFALPSTVETFGLVYIEALSQGLPVLMLKEEAIDGILNPLPGVTIADASVNAIKGGISQIIENYVHFDFSSIDFNQFCWKNIASQYKSVYQTLG